METAAESEDGTTIALPPAGATKVDEVRSLMPAMAGLVILVSLGLGLIFLAWWGARYARRRMGGRLGPSHPLTDEWYSKPLTDRPPPASDHREESEMGS